MTSSESFRAFNDILGGRLSGTSAAPSSTTPAATTSTDDDSHSSEQTLPAPIDGDAVDPLPAPINGDAGESPTGHVPDQLTEARPSAPQDADQHAKDDGHETQPKTAEPQTWIPQVKKAVQFKDLRNNELVVAVEEFTRRHPRRVPKGGTTVEGMFKEYSVVLRRILGSDLRLRDYRLEIQSRGLRDVFKKIGKPYKELDLDKPAIIIRYPFRCLFFLRHGLKTCLESAETAAGTKEEITALLDFINNEPILKEFIRDYETTVEGVPPKFREDRAWMLYQPHELVYYRLRFAPNSRHFQEGCGLVEKVELAEGPRDSLVITLLIGHHTGNRFGLVRFQGTVPAAQDSIQEITIDNLPVIPMRFLPAVEQEKIRARMLKRGKQYVTYSRSPHTMLEYVGPVAVREEETKRLLPGFDGSKDEDGFNWSFETSQRVVVDKSVQHEISPINENRDARLVSPSVRHFLGQAGKPHGGDDPGDEARQMAHIARNSRLLDLGLDLSSSSSSSTDNDAQDPEAEVELTDEDYIVCSCHAIAFLLRDKMWAYLLVGGLREIKWRADPYRHLQMPEDKKLLVRNLVMGFSAEKVTHTGRHHLRHGQGDEDEEAQDSDGDFDDFIAGKGKGLIFLLHGEPGLGKTLTAESVAESTRRPLYHVSTGELDIEVKELENQLTKIFRVGLRWGAVVLLDEADVLMTRRSASELQRNSIVAVFLRMIEYYQGMLFLTTNRLADFDPAFHNRIHISIEYGPLADEQRGTIWKQHLAKACKPNHNKKLWCDKAYALLGKIVTNGRDIRNSTRTAFNYAHSLDQDLDITHVVRVLENNLGGGRVAGLQEIFDQLQALHSRLTGETDGEVCEE